jgi:hypothetical protein
MWLPYPSGAVMGGINSNEADNPMSEYLLKIQTIVCNTVFFNKDEANKYETELSREDGSRYVRAITKTDIFESHIYESQEVFDFLVIEHGIEPPNAMHLVQDHMRVPVELREELLERKRKHIIEKYIEQNQYYVMLSGKPFFGHNRAAAEKVVLIPEEFWQIHSHENAIDRDMPIHEMPIRFQEMFINSPFYQKTIKENPESEYLKYIGSNAIPIHSARLAQDGDIIRVASDKLQRVDPKYGVISVTAEEARKFSCIYHETRDYVYHTLRGDFASIYPNYNDFMRFLTLYMTIGSTMNEFMKCSTKLIHMNKVTANNFFMLYGLPSVIMEGPCREEFLKQMRLFLADKGTNVVYRVKDMIGYDYTDIHTLIMVKQQSFHEGNPVFYTDENGEKKPKFDVFFRRWGTAEDNTSYFKFKNEKRNYTVEEISGADPRWWNSPEVEYALYEMNYTLSNSKYIKLTTHLSMTDIWWQSVVLLRSLLDMRSETQFDVIPLHHNVNGSTEMSVFEAVLTLIVVMNWHLTDFNGNEISGNIYRANADPIFKTDDDGNVIRETLKCSNGRTLYSDDGSPLLGDPIIIGYQPGNRVMVDMLFNSLNEDGSPKELVIGWPFKVSAFNWNIREIHPQFWEAMKMFDFIEPDVFIPMLEHVLDRHNTSVGETVMHETKAVYTYLENKLRSTRTIWDFRQVTNVFKHLFLVDPIRPQWHVDMSFNVMDILMERYQISLRDLTSFLNFFRQYNQDMTPVVDFIVKYNDQEFPMNMWKILNINVMDLEINEIKPFHSDNFRKAFMPAKNTISPTRIMSSNLPDVIKDNWKDIVRDKIDLDVGNAEDGPRTFEALMFRSNPSLHRYLTQMKSTPDRMIMLMRSIIRALEEYTNASLQGLKFSVLGEDEYIKILKDVISYFKSYMVEFTKSEFILMFDGVWDNGGNSNMLRLHDEIAQGTFNLQPISSTLMEDVSQADAVLTANEIIKDVMYDEGIFRIKTTYEQLLSLPAGFELWYDDGERIVTETPFHIPLDREIYALIQPMRTAYKVIINIDNIDVTPPNHTRDERKTT